jgi:hypothetical protein
MPRFYFDLIDGKKVPDVAGQLLRDEGAAVRVADKLARDIYKIRPELRGKDYSILVRDEDGEEVHRADIEAADHALLQKETGASH